MELLLGILLLISIVIVGLGLVYFCSKKHWRK